MEARFALFDTAFPPFEFPAMPLLLRSSLAVLLVALAAVQSFAEEKPRQLERIRTFDVEHLKAELNIDPDKAKLSGTVTHTLKPLHDGFKQLELDCEALTVTKVTVDGREQKFELRAPKLVITLDRVFKKQEPLSVSVTYHGSPTCGMYFIRPDEFYPQKPLCVWTQGEPEQNHFWLPCYDYSNDLQTTEMIVTVPASLFVLSNGRLLENRANEAAGTRTFHWKMDQPHVTYLISLVVGDLVPHELEVGGLKITSYAPRQFFDEGRMKRAFGRTGEMATLFNKLTGVEYPWPKYAQTIVPEFRSGGMENISSTTLTEFTLRDDGAILESTADGLIAHELAHQWWGDLLTCKDWSHLWLNEGFATYYDALFTEYDLGPENFAYKVDGNRKAAIKIDETKPRPMVWDRYERPFEMFDARAYPKGASVLHMLRGLLGDDKFFAGVSSYARKHRHQAVETADFQRAMEEASGKKLDWFFEQWCYKAGAPKLEITWRFVPEDSTARIKVKQTQPASDLVPTFKLPTSVEFITKGKAVRFPVELDSREQELVFRIDAKPDLVRLDPERYLLAELSFKKPADELRHQLDHDPHVLGRAAAADGLAALPVDTANVTALAAALAREKSEYLRRDIVLALGKLKGDEAKKHVLAAVKDRHAIVRRAAIEQLEHFEGPEPLAALREAWQTEPAPQARAATLRMLAKKKAEELPKLLEQALEQRSYRGAIPSAALDILTTSEHPRRRELVVLKSRRGEDEQVRSGALAALAKLAKNDPQLVSAIREQFEDPNYFVRIASIAALGEAGGKSEIELLEARLKIPMDKRESDALRKALEKLRTPKPDPVGAADKKAVDLESEAKQLELKVERLRAEAKQVRAQAKEKAAEAAPQK